jgi:hypothetical protein
MARNIHPADAAVALAIRSAAEFTCSIHIARSYSTERFASLEEARAYKEKLERRAGNGKRAMVYAVQANGSAVFVPDSFKA